MNTTNSRQAVSLRPFRWMPVVVVLGLLITMPLSAEEFANDWRYTLYAPEATWTKPDFDDSGWGEGSGGFGTRGTPGARVGTEWTSPSIWLRKTFVLERIPEKPALLIHHDEDAEVFLNGRSAGEFAGYSRQYEIHPIDRETASRLVAGRNVLAVSCRQTRGGQYIDVHVIDATESAQWLKALAPQQPTAASKTDRSAEPGRFKLLTRWGERVTPENAWREYPRPGMKRGRWRCLNGLWEFAIVGEPGRWTSGRVENAQADPLRDRLPPPPTTWPHKILVPFSPETQLSGIEQSVRPNQVLWYRRTFDVPDDWTDQRILLHFEAVDWHSVVLLNGEKVGENRGGYVPFTCDVTEALTDAGPQQLVVVAWDPTNMGDQTVGKQALPELRRGFRYTPNSGIWQSVWLEPVPQTAYIRDVKITPHADEYAVTIEVDAAGETRGLTVRAAADGEATDTSGPAGTPVRLAVGDGFARWSPETPNLHPLTIQLRRGDQIVDSVDTYFALRKIDMAPDAEGLQRIRLNGEAIFQFGPLDQGYWPDGAMTPPSEEAVRYDLQYLKDIGCNMVRVHIKVHPRRWYYEADRLGLLVWQDFVCSRKFDTKITPASAAQWEQEQRRMIDHLYNCPSVVQWVVFNEGWGQYDTERLTQWTKQIDPSRLVTCASGWTDFPVGDVYDNHDYSFNISPAHGLNFADRATLCGECGGFNVLLDGHLWHSNQTQSSRVNPMGETGRESYDSVAQWESRYRPWLTNLRLMRSGGLNAAVYTQISDVEHECNGWLTYDRAVSKFPVEELDRWHRTLYEPIRTRVLLDLADGQFVHQAGQPPQDWTRPDFDASDWPKTPTPRGDRLTPVVPAGDGQGSVSLRGMVKLAAVPQQLAMRTVGTGDWELCFNGEPCMKISNSDRAGYVPYSTVVLPDSARDLLREGKNTIAVRISGGKNAAPELIDFALLAAETAER